MPTRRAILATSTFLASSRLAAQSILELPPPRPGIRFAYGASEVQFAELRVPAGPGPHPVAIVIHGGYWRARYDLRHIAHLCDALTRQGVATWSLEYRRIGNPGGGWPGTLDDVRAGALYLKTIAAEQSINIKRVVATGHSAGGQLALWLARQKVLVLRAVVPLAAVSNLRRAWELKLSDTVVSEFLGGSPREVPERYRAASPIELLPLNVPQRILHGASDDVVPIEMSREYAAAAKKSGDDSKLIEIAGAGHFELIDPRSTVWPMVASSMLDFLQ
jgi:acetyl esterase/lipase